MKTYMLIAVFGTLAGCSLKQPFALREPKGPFQVRGGAAGLGAMPGADAGSAVDAAAPLRADATPRDVDASIPMGMDLAVDEDAGMPTPEAIDRSPTGTPRPTGPGDADTTPPETAAPAKGVTPVTTGADAGMPGDAPDARVPAVTTDGGNTGPLRSITVRLTGMDDDLHHFAQFRLSNAAHEFRVMFVIHEGLTDGDYTWNLPNALFTDESYHLDFFIDHDETTGPGFYDRPPVDHAWSLEIAEGNGDVEIEFPYNEMFTDIEAIAPMDFHSTVLSSSGMGGYTHRLYDVRVIDRRNGRLVGRQLREVPGDSFDITVGSTTEEGVEYEVLVAVDANGDGAYNYPTDPAWRVLGTADANGLRPSIDAADDRVDVGF